MTKPACVAESGRGILPLGVCGFLFELNGTYFTFKWYFQGGSKNHASSPQHALEDRSFSYEHAFADLSKMSNSWALEGSNHSLGHPRSILRSIN